MTKMRYGKKGFTGDYFSYLDIERLVRDAFGEEAFEHARTIAELDDFDDFVDAMEGLGLPRCYYVQGVREYDRTLSRFANAILIMRYPFLMTRDINDTLENLLDKQEKYDANNTRSARFKMRAAVEELSKSYFAYTYYNDIPSGWAARFGLELCEDIRTILETNDKKNTRIADEHRCELFEGYHIEQIKEKYGTLRWYAFTSMPDYDNDEDEEKAENIRKELSNLETVYEMLSGATCIQCGAIDDVYTSNNGWITVTCYKHLNNNYQDEEAINVWAKEHGYTGNWVGYDLARAIGRILTTHVATFSKIEPDKLVISYGKNGVEENRYPYEELKSAYPNDELQVFKLMPDYLDVEETKITVEDVEKMISDIENNK